MRVWFAVNKSMLVSDGIDWYLKKTVNYYPKAVKKWHIKQYNEHPAIIGFFRTSLVGSCDWYPFVGVKSLCDTKYLFKYVNLDLGDVCIIEVNISPESVSGHLYSNDPDYVIQGFNGETSYSIQEPIELVFDAIPSKRVTGIYTVSYSHVQNGKVVYKLSIECDKGALIREDVGFDRLGNVYMINDGKYYDTTVSILVEFVGLSTADDDMTIQNILDCCPTKAALNVLKQMKTVY